MHGDCALPARYPPPPGTTGTHGRAAGINCISRYASPLQVHSFDLAAAFAPYVSIAPAL